MVEKVVYVEKPVEKVHTNFGSACNRLHFQQEFEQVVEKVVEKVVYVEKPVDKVKGRNRNRQNKMHTLNVVLAYQ